MVSLVLLFAVMSPVAEMVTVFRCGPQSSVLVAALSTIL